jgi:hypothetical protein
MHKMMIFFINNKRMLFLLLALFCVFFLGCNKTGTLSEEIDVSEQNNIEEEPTSSLAEVTTGTIGIAGGEVEVNDPNNPIFGVKVRIAENTVSAETDISIYPVTDFPKGPEPGCKVAGNGVRITSDDFIKTSRSSMALFIPFPRTDDENSLNLMFAYNLSSEQWVEDEWSLISPLPSPSPEIYVGAIYQIDNDVIYFPVICDLSEMLPE